MSNIQEKIFDLHRQAPFISGDPRENIARVKLHIPEATAEFVRYRGTITVGGVCVDSVWLQNQTTGAIIDPTYPIKNPDFVPVCGAWIASGDLDSSYRLRDLIGKASIYEKIIDMPDPHYHGEPYWGT